MDHPQYTTGETQVFKCITKLFFPFCLYFRQNRASLERQLASMVGSFEVPTCEGEGRAWSSD